MKIALIRIRHPFDGLGKKNRPTRPTAIILDVSEAEWVKRVQAAGWDGTITEYAIFEIGDPVFKTFPASDEPEVTIADGVVTIDGGRHD